jgi:hypothetical protein
MRIRHLVLVFAALGPSCGGYDVAGNGRVWYFTCGDPVCTSYRPPAGVARCTSESPGQSCSVEGSRCDPMDSCNRLLVCAQSDPKLGGCPISSRRFKQDVAYLTDGEREACAREVRGLRLARYRYAGSSDVRLGIILEDDPPSVVVDRAREQVDLYGYASLAVAALQAQDRRLEALEREVRELRAALRDARERADRAGPPRASLRPPRPAPGP